MAKILNVTPADLGRANPPVVAAFDLTRVTRILRRYAIAASFQANTRLEWKRYEDLIVRFFSIGEPGTVEVEISSTAQLKADTHRFFESSLQGLRRVAAGAGGGAVLDYLEAKERETHRLRRDVRQLYAEAQDLNEEIRQEAAWTTDKLFAIKVSAEVVFAGAAALSGIGLVAGAAAGIAYNLASTFAMNREEMKQGEILAFVEPTVPPVAAGAAVKAGTNLAVSKATENLGQARLAMEAEAAALRYYQNTFQHLETSAPRMLKDARLFNPKGGLQRPLSTLGLAKGTGKALGFLTSIYFMKDDIAKAMNGYSKSMGY